MTVYVSVAYGMGGDPIDLFASGGYGEDYLIKRLKAVGINTLNSPYQWYDTQKIVDDLMGAPKTAKVASVGDSLGDNALGDIVQALNGHRQVDLIGGFQGSEWGKHTSISSNVGKALIIYNPNFFATAGLGAYPLPLDTPPVVPAGQSLYDGTWRTGNGGKTSVRYVQIDAPHPDDWGLAQDIVFAAIKQLGT